MKKAWKRGLELVLAFTLTAGLLAVPAGAEEISPEMQAALDLFCPTFNWDSGYDDYDNIYSYPRAAAVAYAPIVRERFDANLRPTYAGVLDMDKSGTEELILFTISEDEYSVKVEIWTIKNGKAVQTSNNDYDFSDMRDDGNLSLLEVDGKLYVRWSAGHSGGGVAVGTTAILGANGAVEVLTKHRNWHPISGETDFEEYTCLVGGKPTKITEAKYEEKYDELRTKYTPQISSGNMVGEYGADSILDYVYKSFYDPFMVIDSVNMALQAAALTVNTPYPDITATLTQADRAMMVERLEEASFAAIYDNSFHKNNYPECEPGLLFSACRHDDESAWEGLGYEENEYESIETLRVPGDYLDAAFVRQYGITPNHSPRDAYKDGHYYFKGDLMDMEYYWGNAAAFSRAFRISDTLTLVSAVCIRVRSSGWEGGEIFPIQAILHKADIGGETVMQTYAYYEKVPIPQYLIDDFLAEEASGLIYAAPTTAKVTLDGKPVELGAYVIGGNNYFKLRDLAQALNGTGKQFEVGYNTATGSISLISGAGYTPNGTEHSATPVLSPGLPNAQTVYLNGAPADLKAYTIQSSNYFKLRDLGKALGFATDWDGTTGTVRIDTTKPYWD